MQHLKTFRVKGGKDKGIRMMPLLLAEANKRRLRISTRNLDNEVEVVVAGFLKDINEFYTVVCKEAEEKDAYCTPLEDYPYYIDWDASYQGLIAEGMSKLAEYGMKIESILHEMNSKLDRIDKKLDKLDEISNKLDRLIEVIRGKWEKLKG